jgi:hypothetical protein
VAIESALAIDPVKAVEKALSPLKVNVAEVSIGQLAELYVAIIKPDFGAALYGF